MEEKLSFADLASTRVGDVQPPKAIPDGHYVGVITGKGKIEEAGKKKNLAATFPVRLQEPLDDVDAEALAASDGFQGKDYRVTWWLTPAALFMFTEFGKAMGASDESTVIEMAEHIAQSGEPIVFQVKTGAGENGRPGFTNLDNPMPLAQYQENQANNS